MNFSKWLENDITYQPKSSDISYIAAMLTKNSQQALFHAISKMVQVPPNWVKYCHHMTIKFKPTDDSQIPVLGEEVTLVVTHVSADEKGVAVKVEPNTNKGELKMPHDQLPHITVAVAPGVAPVYSNELLRKGVSQKLPNALMLQAFTGAKLKSGPVMPQRNDIALEKF